MTPAEPRLHRVVSDQIRALLRHDGLPAGARLPSERELATRLQVSRSSLREALIVLEMEGVVQIRGSSRVVAGAVAPQAPGPDPADVLAARRIVGTLVAGAAARHASAHAVDALHSSVLDIEQQADGQDERTFMLAVARASGNAALVDVVAYLWAPGHGALPALPHAAARGAPQRDVVGAIAGHDASAARHAMQSHLAPPACPRR